MLTTEHGKNVFELYAGHTVDALLLALQFTELKHSFKRGRKGVAEAIEGLDRAIEIIYLHTEFHKVSYKLYRQRLEGTLKPKQEELEEISWEQMGQVSGPTSEP